MRSESRRMSRLLHHFVAVLSTSDDVQTLIMTGGSDGLSRPRGPGDRSAPSTPPRSRAPPLPGSAHPPKGPLHRCPNHRRPPRRQPARPRAFAEVPIGLPDGSRRKRHWTPPTPPGKAWLPEVNPRRGPPARLRWSWSRCHCQKRSSRPADTAPPLWRTAHSSGIRQRGSNQLPEVMCANRGGGADLGGRSAMRLDGAGTGSRGWTQQRASW